MEQSQALLGNPKKKKMKHYLLTKKKTEQSQALLVNPKKQNKIKHYLLTLKNRTKSSTTC